MKKLLFCLAALLFLGLAGMPVSAHCLVTGEEFAVGAAGAVVIEAESGKVLFAQDADRKLPMASTTKILTALLTLEQPGLDDPFTVDAGAIRVEGSSMGLAEGDTVTLRALAGGMLLASGNDAANAAAVRIDGTLSAFADRMNARAAELGMTGSSFANPSGLSEENHYSTACDMALLAREALRSEVFRELCSAKSLRLCFGNPPYERTLLNHNKLLQRCEGCIGVKTGFTKTAGRCLVSAAERDGITLICVTLNCADDWNTHIALYDRYFSFVSLQTVSPPELRIPVVGGTAPEILLVPAVPVDYVAVEGAENRLTWQVFSENFLYAPQFGGDIAGKIVYYIDGISIGESPLTVAEDLPLAVPSEQTSVWKRIAELFRSREKNEGVT